MAPHLHPHAIPSSRVTLYSPGHRRTRKTEGHHIAERQRPSTFGADQWTSRSATRTSSRTQAHSRCRSSSARFSRGANSRTRSSDASVQGAVMSPGPSRGRCADHGVPRMPNREGRQCCGRDEGRPLGVGVQDQAPNPLTPRWSRASVVNGEAKGALKRVRYGSGRRTRVNR